jgi:hypothetical protein
LRTIGTLLKAQFTTHLPIPLTKAPPTISLTADEIQKEKVVEENGSDKLATLE